MRKTERCLAAFFVNGGIICLPAGLNFRVDVGIPARGRVIGGPLEDREMPGLLCHDGDQLYGRRARAYARHALAGEIHLLLGPIGRMK